jgi:hypothetical protein
VTANIEALIPAYRSRAEEDYAAIGHVLIADEFRQKVMLTMYEPMAFYIPGGRYRPDFMHILEDGSVVFVEVKKNKHLKSYRDSRAKLRAAAVVFPFFTWVMSLDLVLEAINE